MRTRGEADRTRRGQPGLPVPFTPARYPPVCLTRSVVPMARHATPPQAPRSTYRLAQPYSGPDNGTIAVSFHFFSTAFVDVRESEYG